MDRLAKQNRLKKIDGECPFAWHRVPSFDTLLEERDAVLMSGECTDSQLHYVPVGARTASLPAPPVASEDARFTAERRGQLARTLLEEGGRDLSPDPPRVYRSPLR